MQTLFRIQHIRISLLLKYLNSQISDISAHRISFALADKDFGDTKVTNFDDHLVLVKKNILSLKVSVQDQFVVDVVQGK